MSTSVELIDPNTAARPTVIIVLTVVVVGLAIWLIGPGTYSKTNPYLNDDPQIARDTVSGTSSSVIVVEDL